MGSKPPMRSSPISNTRNRRRNKNNNNNSRKKFAAGKKNTVNSTDIGAGVEEKLEMLKNLIPNPNYTQIQQRATTAGGGDHGGSFAGEAVAVKPAAENDLFRRTADYIVLLRTQVFVLQSLIDFYSPTQKIDDQDFLSPPPPPPADST